MIGTLPCVVLDCHYPAVPARFYAALLGGELDRPDPRWPLDEGWATLHTPDGLMLAFQRVEEFHPPQWPDPAHPQQFPSTSGWPTSTPPSARWSHSGRPDEARCRLAGLRRPAPAEVEAPLLRRGRPRPARGRHLRSPATHQNHPVNRRPTTRPPARSWRRARATHKSGDGQPGRASQS
ncbi:VOC family protein [Kitasatospora sp. NPDC006697]|uniref:VOC family protein n=1 Tax=Kitasatospora sp. NPDC006697 TaxID=3364020 RepID=UPI003688D7FC